MENPMTQGLTRSLKGGLVTCRVRTRPTSPVMECKTKLKEISLLVERTNQSTPRQVSDNGRRSHCRWTMDRIGGCLVQEGTRGCHYWDGVIPTGGTTETVEVPKNGDGGDTYGNGDY